MADKNKISEMLESLLNNEQDKAEELFHEYVVEKSREIYENLIDSEIDEASKDEDEDDLEEASKKEEDDEEMDESFVDIDEEADEEEGEDEGGEDEGDDEEGDATDDFMSDVEDGEEGEEGDEEDPATKGDVMDLKSEIEQLQAAFDSFMSDEANEPEHNDMGDEMGMGDSLDAGVDQIQDLSTVREYVEKVPSGHGAEKKGAGEQGGVNAKTPVAGKNDMGGTTANIAKGGEAGKGGTQGGLLNPSTKEDNAGNINVPGGKAGNAFSKKEPGHGAEKKGQGETGTNTTSLFRGK